VALLAEAACRRPVEGRYGRPVDEVTSIDEQKFAAWLFRPVPARRKTV
jgi:hypothetical protein